MEAVQLLQNPGMPVSGKIAPSAAGQTVDGTGLPVFEQMFAQAAAGAGITQQPVVEPLPPQSVMASLPVTDTAAFPFTGQIPALLTAGAPPAVENAGGGVESSETGLSPAAAPGTEVSLMPVQGRERAGKPFVRKEHAPGKKPETKGGAPAAGPEVEKESVDAEPATREKREVRVAVVDETPLQGRAIPEKDEATEASFHESGTALLPRMTPEIPVQAAIAHERVGRAEAGEVSRIPVRQKIAAAAADFGDGGGPFPSVSDKGPVVSEPSGKEAEPATTGIASFQKTGHMRADTHAAAPEKGTGFTVAAETPDPEVVSAMEYDTEVRKFGRQDADPLKRNPDAVNGVQGEAVLRQVSGGVTVANPVRTALMGTSGAGAGMRKAMESVGESPSQPVRKVEEDVQVVSKASLSEAGQPDAGNHAPVSAGDESRQQNAGEGKAHPDGTVSIARSGSFEKTVQGAAENPRAPEGNGLRDSILSQVKEKLASFEAGTGTNRITLKLNPRELGDMQIQIRMEDAKVSVEITAQNPVVREALVQNIDQLRETLLRRDLAMERFDVLTGNGQTPDQSFREGRQAGHPRFENLRYGDGVSYREEPVKSTLSYGEGREDSLVDMRF